MTPEDVYGDAAPLYERWVALQRKWALVDERYQIARVELSERPNEYSGKDYSATNHDERITLRLEAMELAVEARLVKDGLDLAMAKRLRGGND